jgi:hypothetical protein
MHASKQKPLSILTKAAPFVAGLLMAATSQPAAAEVFSIGGTFTVSGGNSPDTFSQSVTLAPGTTSLDGGALSLTISIVPVGDAAQNEWLVFSYQTPNGGALSLPGEDWSLDQTGLPAAIPGVFDGDFAQFLNSDGHPFDQTVSIFGQTLMSNPVPGGTGNGEGSSGYASDFSAGPVFELGAFSDPFDIVTNAEGSDAVTGFVQALEFRPQTPTSAVPEPFTLSLFGAGLAGAAASRRRKKAKA